MIGRAPTTARDRRLAPAHGSAEAREIYKERAATAECANAQARNRGLLRLVVRGVDKVRAVLLWHALAHNMARLWSLCPA